MLCGVRRVGSMGNRHWVLAIWWCNMKALGGLEKYYSIWW